MNKKWIALIVVLVVIILFFHAAGTASMVQDLEEGIKNAFKAGEIDLDTKQKLLKIVKDLRGRELIEIYENWEIDEKIKGYYIPVPKDERLSILNDPNFLDNQYFDV